jgi:hypothetical protein
MIRNSRTTHHVSHLLLSLALFLLALAPRLPGLGRFLTADEFLWADRSRNFLAGLTNPAFQCDSVVEKWNFVAQGLACTLRTGHPGVTTMWTGSLGYLLRWLADGRPQPLHDYVVAVSTNPLDARFIEPERLGTVLITSLWVVAVYWLVRRLWGGPIALVGAVLIALDPFHIALSRVIHHDALSTTFMTLSVLGMLIYWGESRPGVERGGRRRRWLLCSGLWAGLAFLSKSASLFLMPFVALIGLWFTLAHLWSRRQGYRANQKPLLPTPRFASLLPLILDGLLWFALALVAVFICWPAMWVAPLEAVETVLSLSVKYSTGGHAKGNFLLGQISQDPGPLFYPVTWLYRTTPLVLIGLSAIVIAGVVNWRKQANKRMSEGANGDLSFAPSPIRSFFRYLPVILLFIFGYYLLMTIGEKKQDRYFLPAYPWLNLIAAAGLIAMLDFGRAFLGAYASRLRPDGTRVTSILVVLVVLVNGYLVITNFPYYFTYFNPLLGGIQGAARAVTIGWGEGLDLAAAYLNQHTDPAHTRVTSWYQSTFAPFYRGQSISYSKEKGKALAGDYVIFYINQTQRRFPDEVMFDYFESRYQPEKVITLNGLDYAWIYPSRGIDHYVEDQTYTGIASLLAWQWRHGDGPLSPAQPADFDLYWEYLGKRSAEPFFFRLVDAQGRPWAEGQSQPVAAENPPPGQWREGEIITERGALTISPGTPLGQYRLHIGFYTQAPAVTTGELLFTLPVTDSLVAVGRGDPLVFTLPPDAKPIAQPLGDSLTLLGATWPTRPLITNLQSPLTLDLYWRVEKAIPADVGVHVGLMDQGGVARQAWFEVSLAETFNPSATTWQPGDIIHTSWQFELLPELPPGHYTFDLVLPQATPADRNSTVNFGQVSLESQK